MQFCKRFAEDNMGLGTSLQEHVTFIHTMHMSIGALSVQHLAEQGRMRMLDATEKMWVEILLQTVLYELMRGLTGHIQCLPGSPQ